MCMKGGREGEGVMDCEGWGWRETVLENVSRSCSSSIADYIPQRTLQNWQFLLVRLMLQTVNQEIYDATNHCSFA